MIQRFHAMKEQREEGFTLIELLVVILIIAILAAIAIPVFLNQRQKGYVADVQSTLKNAATAVESAATQTNGNYSTITTNMIETQEGFKDAGADQTTTVTGAASSYCIVVTDTRLGAATGAHAWQTASYDSDVGRPQSADACT